MAVTTYLRASMMRICYSEVSVPHYEKNLLRSFHSALWQMFCYSTVIGVRKVSNHIGTRIYCSNLS